ncbi:S-layer homology domain-containing protein [Priestia koreensis]|uniref:S-layer homology domain-containing protein n=1 Tax=Priestia koreensis TaxID=284581 RepID=UPI003D081D9D
MLRRKVKKYVSLMSVLLLLITTLPVSLFLGINGAYGATFATPANEDFENPPGEVKNGGVFGDWEISFIDDSGELDALSDLSITAENETNHMLRAFNLESSNYLLVKPVNKVNFRLKSLKVIGASNNSYTVFGYKSGLFVSEARETFVDGTNVINFTNNAWNDIDEFRIERTDSSNDMDFELDDIIVTDPIIASQTPQVSQMGGAVTVDGDLKYGSTLSANVSQITYSPSTNSDRPTYQWYRGEEAIEGATNNSYTVTKQDINHQLKIRISADGTNATGYVESGLTANIEKSEGPQAPVAPVEESATSHSITLKYIEGQEYSKDNGAVWQDSSTFNNLNSSTLYTFITRVKETEYQKSSGFSSATVIETKEAVLPEIAGDIYIEGSAKYGGVLSVNLDNLTYHPDTKLDHISYQWYQDSTLITGATNETYVITKNNIGKKMKVKVMSDGINATGSLESQPTDNIEKADGPDAPMAPEVNSKTSTSIKLKSNNDQEYSIDNGETWNENASFLNLIPGTEYKFISRIKETDTTKSSANSNQTIIPTNDVYTITYNGNNHTSGLPPADIKKYEEGSTVTVIGNTGRMARSGYQFMGWNTSVDGSGSTYQPGSSFQMGTNNVTLYAKWKKDLTGSNAGAPVINPSQPGTEIITAPIETGGVGSGTIVMNMPITRTTDSNGVVKDSVDMNLERAKGTIKSVLEAGQTTARLVIPDEKDVVSEVTVNVLKEAVKETADKDVNLEIFTDNGRILVPQESLDNFANDLYFRITPVKKEEKKKEIENRAKVEDIVKRVTGDSLVTVVSRPIEIDTNMQSRPVTLILPLRDFQLPDDKKQEEFLSHLFIYIEHSDGELELVKAKVVEFKQGQLGLEFNVNKFSTFTILHVENLKENRHKGYIRGYEDGTFRPNNVVTRAQAAMMIAKNMGYEDVKFKGNDPFLDVKTTHWSAGAIEFVKTRGMMQGDHSGYFHPNVPITRAELAVIIARYNKLALPSETESSIAFSDIKGHWAMTAIASVKIAGLISGYPNGTFRPNSYVNRAECVKMINRMFNRGPLYGINKLAFKDIQTNHWAFAEISEASQDHAYIYRTTGGEEIVE